MANFNKFKVTWEGSGSIFVGGQLRSSGDEFTLTSDQVNRYIKTSDFEDGFIIPLDENSSAFSDDIQRQLDGKSRAFSKGNFAAADVLNLVTTTTAGVAGGGAGYVGNELTGGIDVGRRGAVAKILSRTPAIPVLASTYEPRLLVSAGEEVKVSPTVVKKYVALTGVYSNLTNGSIAAANLAAANDMLVVGFTEKFASLAFHVVSGSANTASQVFNAVYYWNGSAWTAFDNVSDMTTDTYDGVKSLAKVGTVSRVAWFTKPTDWVLGGPSGSGCGELNYCVALRVSGTFTNLASCGVYPVMDTPIADIMLGSNVGTFDAVVTSMGSPAVFTDATRDAADTGLSDVGAQLGPVGDVPTHGTIILGSTSPFQGFAVTIDGVANEVEQKMVINYWNGTSWSANADDGTGAWAGTITDGTYSSGTLIADGIVSWTAIPSNWQPAPMTDLTGFTATGLTTVTTDALYWVRLSSAVQLAGALGAAAPFISQLTIVSPSKTWIETTPVGSAFVEAGDVLKVTVMDAEVTATVEMKAVLMDV